jgi:hypothetical protein
VDTIISSPAQIAKYFFDEKIIFTNLKLIQATHGICNNVTSRAKQDMRDAHNGKSEKKEEKERTWPRQIAKYSVQV